MNLSSIDARIKQSTVSAFHVDKSSIFTITLLIQAFACHNTLLPVYDELSHRTLDRMAWAVSTAMALAFSLYTCIGLAGYWTFGATTQDNILLSYTEHLQWLEQAPMLAFGLRIGQACMASALLFTCPIALWPFRSCVLSVYLRLMHGQQLSSSMASYGEFVAMTVTIELLILTCAIFVPSVKIPLSIVGSVSGSLIIFIMPSIFYLVLSTRHGAGPILQWKNRGPLALLLMGIVLGIVGFSLTMVHLF